MVCVSGWWSAWCRKLRENKTVVGGSEGEERVIERRELYLLAQTQVLVDQ